MRSVRIAVALFAALAVAAPAWGASRPAKPLAGARYEGTTSHASSALTLKVARSGRTVTFSLPILPTYCATPGHVLIQHTIPARISARGAFTATITYDGLFTSGTVAKGYVKGRFNGRRATGTVRSEYLQVQGCDGSSAFSASAPRKRA
ncbi:MAG TPA: hypothetical protein VN618_01395 [Solirubrobacteraceae bacterium]|nr:hypothetical protein [Solirubrobacteraceae bacterium]